MDDAAKDLVATTHLGRVSVTLGGVARNVAETASQALRSDRSAVKLISAYGNDDLGLLLHQRMQRLGMRIDGLFHPSSNKDSMRTAVCSLLLDKQGDLISGVADMAITQSQLTPGSYEAIEDLLERDAPGIVAFDGNLGDELATQLLTGCQKYAQRHPSQAIRTVFEPTSVTKSKIVLQHFCRQGSQDITPICYATPNIYELHHIYDHAQSLGLLRDSRRPSCDNPSAILPTEAVEKASALIQAGIFNILLIKMGKLGVVAVSEDEVRHQAIPAGDIAIVNTTGCGDSFAGGFIAALCKMKEDDLSAGNLASLDKAILAGQLAAQNTIQSSMAVGPHMDKLLASIGLEA